MRERLRDSDLPPIQREQGVYNLCTSFVQGCIRAANSTKRKVHDMKKPLRYILALLATLSTAALAQSDLPATVVDLAAADADLSTLVSAVQTAGLAETLSSEGPFTVFAPTNAAFEDALAALGITAEQLLAREDLATILT